MTAHRLLDRPLFHFSKGIENEDRAFSLGPLSRGSLSNWDRPACVRIRPLGPMRQEAGTDEAWTGSRKPLADRLNHPLGAQGVRVRRNLPYGPPGRDLGSEERVVHG